MWRLFGGDPNGSGVVGPYSEPGPYPRPQADDIERLKRAVIHFIEQHPHHPDLRSAVHALMYLGAPDAMALLTEVLEDCIGRDPIALYQAILALEGLGADIYGPRSHSSFDEVEINEAAARRYLAAVCQG